MSGTGDSWFTAPAPVPDGMYFAGYGPDDANPDIGDSAITETNGLGSFALAAARAIVGFTGGTPAQAVRISKEMATITMTRHRSFHLPSPDFAATPYGIECPRSHGRAAGLLHRCRGRGRGPR